MAIPSDNGFLAALVIACSRHVEGCGARCAAVTAELASPLSVVLERWNVPQKLTLERMAVALEHVGDSIEITDTKYRIEHVNTAFERLTGFSREEAIGRTPAELLRSGAHTQAFYEDMEQTVLRGDTWRGRVVGRRKDGTTWPAETTLSPVLDGKGRITGFVALKRDISLKEALEERLRANERLVSLGNLAAGVAHEINNPLTYVLMNLEYLSHALPRLAAGKENLEPLLKRVEEAMHGSARIRRLVQDLLHFAHPGDETPVELEIREVIAQALSMSTEEMTPHTQVVTELSSLPRVRAGESALTQVFGNLLVNAAQAVADRDSGNVKVSSARDDTGDVIVEVSDTGVGMKPEVLARATEPFFTTKPAGTASGLGLAVAQGIVSSLGGRLEISSREGSGTTVRVLLPPCGRPVLGTLPELPEVGLTAEERATLHGE